MTTPYAVTLSPVVGLVTHIISRKLSMRYFIALTVATGICVAGIAFVRHTNAPHWWIVGSISATAV